MLRSGKMFKATLSVQDKVNYFETQSPPASPTTKPPDGLSSSEWSAGLKRLHRAISISSQRSQSSYEDALNRLLREVRENENATQEDILHKLMTKSEQDPSKSASSVASRAGAILNAWSGQTARLRKASAAPLRLPNPNEPRSKSIADIPLLKIDRVSRSDGSEDVFDEKMADELVEEEKGHDDEEREGEDEEVEVDEGDTNLTDESYHKLEAVAKALTESGRSGLDLLRGALEHENLQTGFDRVITHVLHTFQDQWSQLFELLVPWQQMQAMFLICCLQLINLQQLFKLLPIVSCYVSFMIMIYCTLKMFHSRYWTKKAKVWRRLLNVFKFSNNTTTTTATATSTATSRKVSFRDTAFAIGGGGASISTTSTNLVVGQSSSTSTVDEDEKEPFGNYFLALAAFVFSFALADRRMLPNLFPACALSIFFSFACLLSSPDRRHDNWLVSALALDLCSNLPVLAKKYFHFKVFKIFENFLTLRLGSSLRIGLGLSSMSSAGILLLYAYLTIYHIWRENSNSNSRLSALKRVLIPHSVCLAWFHTGLELFQTSDSNFEWRHALLTACVIWLILFPTWTAGSAFLVVALIQVKDFFNAMNVLRTLSIAFIFFIPYAYKRFTIYMDHDGDWSSSTYLWQWWKERRRKAILVYVLLAIVSGLILYGGRESPAVLKQRTTSNLTWSEFYEHCSKDDLAKNAHQNGNLLTQQISCSEFGSTVIEWTGVVESIRITNIENFLESIFYYLPDDIAQKVRCLYGTKTDAFNGTTSTRKRCTVAQYNVYTFEMDIRGPWKSITTNGTVDGLGPGVALVEASDVFESIAMDLQKSDIVNFTAILADDILKFPPKMHLLQIECMRCPRVVANKRTSRVVSEAFYSEDHWFWTKLYTACRFVFNFACAPLLAIE